MRKPRNPSPPCDCGCERPVLGRGRFATRACWARTMNASWSPERKHARSSKAGRARQANRERSHPRLSASSRLL